MKIVKAKKSDFYGVFELLNQLWPDKNLNRFKMRNVYYRGISYKFQEFLVAKEKNQILGFGSMVVKNSLWQAGNLGYIDELVVDERVRGKKIGARLLQAMIILAKKHDCRTIKLDSAFFRKRAHKFYENKGFKKCAYLFLKEL